MNKLISLFLISAFLITGNTLSMVPQDADWGHKVWLLQTMPEDRVSIVVDNVDKHHSLSDIRHHVGLLFDNVTFTGDRANPDKLIINLSRIDSYPLQTPCAVHNFAALLRTCSSELVVLKRGNQELNYTADQKHELWRLIIQTASSLVYTETEEGEPSVAVHIGLLPDEFKATLEKFNNESQEKANDLLVIDCAKRAALSNTSHTKTASSIQPKKSTLRNLLVPVTAGFVGLGLGYLWAKKFSASEQ